MRVRITGAAPPRDLIAGFRLKAERALTAGMQGVAAGMLLDMRRDIEAAFPGSRRMATTITGRGYPDRGGASSLQAAAIVRARGKSAAEILAAHRGSTITAGGRKLMAVPTDEVPRIGGRKMKPEEVERRFSASLVVLSPRTLGPGQKNPVLVLRETVTRGKRRGRVVVRRDRRLRIMFQLVARVDLLRRLQPEEVQARWVARAPALIDQAWQQLGRDR